MNPDTFASDLLGYSAAALVLVTFLAQQITTLRAIAIASNVMFIAYASLAWLPPVLVLHALLLPINVWRLWQASRAPPPLARAAPSLVMHALSPVMRAPALASFRAGAAPVAPPRRAPKLNPSA